MKKNLLIGLVVMLSLQLKAQDCESYFPLNEGSEVELHSFDAKGKLTGKSIQKLVSKEETADGLEIIVHQTVLDSKDKNQGENDLKYVCSGGTFYIDMNSMMSPQQKEGYEGTNVEVNTENLDIPSNPTVGQTLQDGYIEMKIVSESPVNMSMRIDVTNRKVEAIEDVTTPAGTFKCYKISQDVNTKAGFIKTTVQSISWYSKNAGVVKSESYNKGKLMGKEELASIKN